MIKKLASGKYRLISKTGRNLGTFATLEEAEKRERQVKHFKDKNVAPKIQTGVDDA